MALVPIRAFVWKFGAATDTVRPTQVLVAGIGAMASPSDAFRSSRPSVNWPACWLRDRALSGAVETLRERMKTGGAA